MIRLRPVVTQRRPYTPAALIVRLASDVLEELPADTREMTGLRLPQAQHDPFDHLRRSGQLRSVLPLFGQDPTSRPRPGLLGLDAMTLGLVTSLREPGDADLAGYVYLRFSKSTDLEATQRLLTQTPGVRSCHRIARRWVASPRPSTTDPMLNRQWNLRAIDWFGVQDLPDASSVKVAILDTGYDTRHPDLPRPASYTHRGSSAIDIQGHGTHVAGIIAARTDNALGLAGIASPALHIWKVFGDEPDDDDDYYTDDVAYHRALADVARLRMDVINLSLAGPAGSPTEKMLLQKAVRAGVTVVAAMGNDYEYGNPTMYPAAFPGVIAVGATDEANRRAKFSSTGKHIALSAPGTSILSTMPMKSSDAHAEVEYMAESGTSMAAPHVTAAVALLKARHPDLTPAQVRARLTARARALPRYRLRSSVGAGLLDLARLLKV